MKLSSRDLQRDMALILLLGTLAAIACVAIGGFSLLWQHGQDPLNVGLLQASVYRIDIRHFQLSFTAIPLIELGLLILVISQIVRVCLLVFYYGVIKDYRFVVISSFVLLVMLITFIGQK